MPGFGRNSLTECDYEDGCSYIKYGFCEDAKPLLKYFCSSGGATNVYSASAIPYIPNFYDCTKLIELTGWKIPDDYPIKF